MKMKTDSNLKIVSGEVGAVYELKTVSPTAKKQRFWLKTKEKNYFIEAFNNYFLLNGLKVGDKVTVEINSKMYNDHMIDYLYSMVESPVKSHYAIPAHSKNDNAKQKAVDDNEKQLLERKLNKFKEVLRDKIYLELYNNSLSHFQTNQWSLSDLGSMLKLICENLTDVELEHLDDTVEKHTKKILSVNFEAIAVFILHNGKGRFQIWTKGYVPRQT